MSHEKVSPTGLVDRLYKEYVEPDYVNHSVYLSKLDSQIAPHSRHQRQKIATLSEALEDISPCAINFESFEARVADVDQSRLAYEETALVYAGVLIDVTRRYPDIERRTATRRLNRALTSDGDISQLREAGKSVLELGRTVAAGDKFGAEIDPSVFAHPDDTCQSIRGAIRNRVETGKIESIAKLRQHVHQTLNREWKHDDLMSFDPYAFEELVAACWRTYQNAAATTRGSRDRGIDIVVETNTNDRLLVQVKRYDVGNSVGISEVQRTGGLLEEFHADRAVLVTSSSFTMNALESADAMDNLRLVNGERIRTWLNDSPLVPPLNL